MPKNNEGNNEGKCQITQTGSTIGQTERICRVMQSLGLGKIGQVREHDLSNPCVKGMLKKVCHLVEITKA